MQIKNLPDNVKKRLLDRYNNWSFSEPMPGVSDPRDPTRFREHIDNEIRSIIESLKQPSEPILTDQLYKNLELWGWFENLEIRNYFY
jgi:hypothetical protein